MDQTCTHVPAFECGPYCKAQGENMWSRLANHSMPTLSCHGVWFRAWVMIQGQPIRLLTGTFFSFCHIGESIFICWDGEQSGFCELQLLGAILQGCVEEANMLRGRRRGKCKNAILAVLEARSTLRRCSFFSQCKLGFYNPELGLIVCFIPSPIFFSNKIK